MFELALFAGSGGGILGSHLAGWRTVAAVEIDAYCRSILLKRQDEGHLPPFPIWDDARTFDGRPFRGVVDLVSAGFPCQPFSSASRGRRVATDLWPEALRIIRECCPHFVLAENVQPEPICAAARDLKGLGYVAHRSRVSAAAVGAGHRRVRYWVVAHPHCHSQPGGGLNEETSVLQEADRAGWWTDGPSGVARVAHGVAHRMDRGRALGNGQVPAVVLRVLEEAGLTIEEGV